MQFRLRTLMILLVVLPPLLWIGWGRYQAWKAKQDMRAELIRALNYVGTVQNWPIPLPGQPSNQEE
jgi:hypothetical protein